MPASGRRGFPPPHPVLLRLSVGGPRSGGLTVGAVGAQKWCKDAFVVWHDLDAQGQPTTDPVFFDYTLGTLSLLPGVEPDPDHPGQVKPVWGAAEALDISTEVITPEATLLNLTTFLVRPQPGKPYSLVDWDGPPEDDRWEWWNGFSTYYDPAKQARAVWVTNYNAYTLVDRHGNTVWGCRDTRTMHGGSRLTVNFPYQESTGPDFRAYALETKWWADSSDQMPQGATSVGLYVNYPESPGDWPAGSVSTGTLIDLQGGSQTHLKSYGGYEASFGIDDGAFPMPVSPEAGPEAIPKVGPGPAWATPRNLESHRRLALVLLTGRDAPSAQEVFRAPHHRWESSGGAWVEKPVVPAPDPHIDIASKPRLKLKLIAVNGIVQTAASFKVHLCPRFDHEAAPNAPEWACPTAPVESTNGVIEELAMNPGPVGNGDPPAPDATGYLGLELTKAPTAPGTYYVYVESLDKDVKVRDQSLLHLDDTPEGQFQGGFALCTVTGLQLLDEGFANVSKTLNVSVDRSVYLRERMSGEAGADYRADVVLKNLDTTAEAGLQNVVFRRLGKSDIFQTDLISIVSPDPPLQPPNAGPEPRFSPLFLQRQAMAGTVTPTPGRHSVSRRREGGGESRAAFAATRLAEITFATPNFDGMSPGRGEIFANVRPGANGRVAVTMTNVNDARIFTFDTWTESGATTRLTTDLTQPLSVGQEQSVTRDQIATFPAAGEPSFRAIANPANDPNGTVNPGLYRLQAAWKGGTPLPAELGAGDFCGTDKEQYPVCRNEWIVSVGQRILVEVEQAAKPALAGYLTQVGDPRSVDAFLQEAAAAITAKYTDAGANVVVSFKAESVPHPRLKHVVISTLGNPTSSVSDLPPYGFTRDDVAFPNADADMDLTSGQCGDGHFPCGISLAGLFKGWARGDDPNLPWPEHLPHQPRNTPPATCGSVENPCPPAVFRNRFVNVVAHETSHGFGVMTSKQFRLHGDSPTAAGMNWIFYTADYGIYLESRSATTPRMEQHEPIGLEYGFGQGSTQANGWLMTAGIFRWRNQDLFGGSSYDADLQRWLIFDRPLSFSRSADYAGRSDQSLEQFFRERVPLCIPSSPRCR